jgi:hypothetical protein
MGEPSSQVEGMTEAAAMGVRPCLDSAGGVELAMGHRNNFQRRKSPTLKNE